jgi:hypothetical protein
MPKWSSYEWFSIISTTMCSICGSVSVPSGSFGFGREPGRRTGGAVVDGGCGALLDGEDLEDPDDEHAASAVPAARAPSPFNIDRRLSPALASS